MVNAEQLQIKSYANASEQAARQQMGDWLFQNPIPPDQLLSNLGLFLNPSIWLVCYSWTSCIVRSSLFKGWSWSLECGGVKILPCLRHCEESMNHSTGTGKLSDLIRLPVFHRSMKKTDNRT